MIFVDTNVFMYAVGRPHPLRAEAQAFFEAAMRDHLPLVTSAEVLQELLHVYLPVDRISALDAAWSLAESLTTVWPVEADDVRHARRLIDRHPTLDSRDLLHLASCQRRGVKQIKTYDRALAAQIGP